MVYFVATIASILLIAFLALLPLFLLLYLGEFTLNIVPLGRLARFCLIMLKSLRRNLLRTSLTYLASFMLVIVVVLVWSLLYSLELLMGEKTKDLKVIVSEKWNANSEMPFSHARDLSEGAARSAADARPRDAMTWQFYVGTLDPAKKTRENLMFFFALDPSKWPMMESLFDDFTPERGKNQDRPRGPAAAELLEAIHKMEKNKRAVIVGRERLKAINKQVGERFTLTGINYLGIDLEFEIVGIFPPGRYDDNAIMHRDYLNDALERYKTREGARHPLSDKSLNLVWLQVENQKDFARISEQIELWSTSHAPAVKAETLASGVANWLGGYNDMLWGMRWLLAPALLAVMTLVIANAISISVRERRMEMAVLKVLGFRPVQILLLVLGEAVLIGTLSGLFSAGTTYLAIDEGLSRANADFPIYIPRVALWWGPAAGCLSALVGSVVPALSACRVKVSEVFARVA